jgi:ATP-binding cassette, subfamily B, multidrug efflux pump
MPAGRPPAGAFRPPSMNRLRSILPFVRPYRGALALGLFFVVLSNATGVLAPFLLGRAIDTLVLPDASLRMLAGYAALVILATVASGATRFGMRRVLNGTSRRIETDLRQAFFEKLLRLDAGFHAGTRTGDLMSRATNDTQAVRMAVGPGVMYLVNTVVMTAFTLVFMIRYSPLLTVIALAPMTLLPVVMSHFGHRIHARFEQIQEHFGTLSTMVQENLAGVRIVRAYGQEHAQEAEFAAINRGYLRRNMALARITAVFHPLLTLLTGLGMLLVLWIGGRQVMVGAMSVGDFIAFGFYLAMLTWPMIALGWVINLFQRGAASMARLERILNTEPAIRSAAAGPAHVDVRGDLELRGVSFRYPGSDRWVLRELDLHIRAGSTVAIVGPTGAGKSTLLALLARRYDPVHGVILLDGTPLPEVPLDALHRALGVVPQDAFVFSDTITGNIAFGIPESVDDAERRARVHEATRVAQLDTTVRAFPHGYDTMLGERGINLSGGQRQRATLARALARDPAILMLDDALSAVDTQTEIAILNELRSVLRGRTSILVSHRVSAVMEADLIVVLEDGRIVERGRHRELVARGGLYAGLLHRQLLEEGLDGALAADTADL